MHILLTDRMSCPRCGPDFGLILLAHEVRDRRILHGDFGCANCRDSFTVENGFGDLRPPPRTPLTPDEPSLEATQDDRGGPSDPSGEAALRGAALMGVTEGPGPLLMAGPVTELAEGVANLVEGLEVVALAPALRFEEERPGVSRMVSGPLLPFFSATFKAVYLSGDPQGQFILEAIRVLAPGGRLVLDGPSARFGDQMADVGLQVVLREEDVLVGLRTGGPRPPLVTLRGP